MLKIKKIIPIDLLKTSLTPVICEYLNECLAGFNAASAMLDYLDKLDSDSTLEEFKNNLKKTKSNNKINCILIFRELENRFEEDYKMDENKNILHKNCGDTKSNA